MNSLRSLYRYILLLQVFLGQYCFGQYSSKDPLFNKFRQDVLIEQREHHGWVVWDDETRESYYTLLIARSIKELVKYTDDSVPAVRAEIFSGLVQKNADESTLREILNKHLNDTAKFTEGATDVILTWSVREIMKLSMDFKPDVKHPALDYRDMLEKLRRRHYVAIPGIHHGLISKDSLLKADSLVGPEGLKIVSFTVTVGEKIITSNNVISKEIKTAIGELKPGNGIYFESIKAEGPDKTTRTITPVLLKVK